MTEYRVVYITAPSEDEAVRIGRTIIEERLAACVNLVRHIRSIYRWQGKVEDESEVLMIAKTRQDLLPDLIRTVKNIHSYTVPEIIAMPIAGGSPEYLAWISDETGPVPSPL